MKCYNFHTVGNPRERTNKRKRFKKEEIVLHLARAGEVTLETLLGMIVSMGELTIAMMGATSKRESARNMWRTIGNHRDIRIDLRSKAALSMMLSRMKKEGLVEGERGTFLLTKKGRKNASRMTLLKKLPFGKNILVIFDIPEELSSKRQWLRNELKCMEFEMIQKSVWRGDVVIPKRFVENIHDLKIENYVHIFEITKLGTMR